MEPVRDDLEERVRCAARPDEAAVERVVRAALSAAPDASAGWQLDGAQSRAGQRWPAAFAVASVCLVAVVALGAWWCARVPAPEAHAEAQGQIISVTTDDGSTWILSTTPDDDWLPAGSSIVIGGGEAR
jgi:ferric-dicitrate binding protein FerR (iron transport regulator)